MPRIPNAIRHAIISKLTEDPRPLNAGQVSCKVNEVVKGSHKRTSRQMAFILKQMAREGDLEKIEVSKNGINQHGNPRTRVEYALAAIQDPDVMTKEESQ